MEPNELIKKIEEIEAIIPEDSNKWSGYTARSFYITTIQFIKSYVGVNTEFYKSLDTYNLNKSYEADSAKAWAAKMVLKSLRDYLKLGLDFSKTEMYSIKIDIINDFMIQADELASDKKFHPAAAGILMGAALEEFLKKVSEEREVDLTGIKLTIDPISKRLYDEQIISKQDLKDITSWAGIRNDATHGNFDIVNDRKRILNAIEGVNLFMRKLDK